MSGHALLYVPKSIVHRWITVLVTCVLVIGAGLPVIWLLVKPYCVVGGAIHVAPFIPNMLTGEPSGQIADYGQYMNTQAIRMTSGPILQDVADDVARRSLAFFTPERPVGVMTRLKQKLGLQPIPEGPVDTLKAAIVAGTISAEPIPHSEYIGVTMKYPDEREAGVVINSFLQQFENSHWAQAAKDTSTALAQLEDQKRELEHKMRRQQDALLQIAREHGTTAADSRQEMAQQRQKTLAAELTRLEIERLHLEAKTAVLERGGDSNMTEDVLAAEFDEQMRSRARERNKQRLASAKAELEQIQANEDRLREVLNEEELEPRRVGLASADFQRLQLDLDLDRQLYEQVARRKREMEMQPDRRGRVSIAYIGELESTVDSRAELSGIVCLAGLLAGLVLAVARGPRKASR